MAEDEQEKGVLKKVKDGLYAFCTTCEESIEIDDCFHVKNIYECPICRNEFSKENFEECFADNVQLSWNS